MLEVCVLVGLCITGVLPSTAVVCTVKKLERGIEEMKIKMTEMEDEKRKLQGNILFILI